MTIRKEDLELAREMLSKIREQKGRSVPNGVHHKLDEADLVEVVESVYRAGYMIIKREDFDTLLSILRRLR